MRASKFSYIQNSPNSGNAQSVFTSRICSTVSHFASRSVVNRAQVRDGTAILAFLMPVFVDLMMDHPQEDWGHPFYPVIE